MNLFWKIFISVFISFFVIGSFVSYLISIEQISETERDMIDKHKTIVSFLSKEIEVGYFESRWPFESLKKLSEHKGFLFWWIVKEDGTIYLADNVAFMGTYAHDYFPHIASTSMSWEETISLNPKQNYGIFFKRLDTGKEKWSFWFGCSMEEVSKRKKEIILLISGVSLSALFVFGIFLYVGTKHFTKPIEKLSVGAATIGKGDLTYRVRIRSRDELGQLANSFNKMADNLKESQEYLLTEITERKRIEEALRKKEEATTRLAQENAIMAEIGRIISSTLNVEEVYERFAEEAYKLIPCDGIAINIINHEEGTVTVPYGSGVTVPGCQPGDVFSLEDSITGEVMRRRSTLIIQTEDKNELKDKFPTLLTAFDAGLKSVMVVPLIFRDQVIGAMHIRSRKPMVFSDHDLKLGGRIGFQIAGAIANAQIFLKQKEMEEAREKLIREIQGALSQIKQLKGLLPICSYCKKIRDDKDYWQSVESYVSEHTEAVFSHGICPECHEKYIEPQLKQLSDKKKESS